MGANRRHSRNLRSEARRRSIRPSGLCYPLPSNCVARYCSLGTRHGGRSGSIPSARCCKGWGSRTAANCSGSFVWPGRISPETPHSSHCPPPTGLRRNTAASCRTTLWRPLVQLPCALRQWSLSAPQSLACLRWGGRLFRHPWAGSARHSYSPIDCRHNFHLGYPNHSGPAASSSGLHT